MPIPMPPPPPPYVAPDLRPIVATPTASLRFERLPGGRVVGRSLTHGLWLAAEGAPLELRFHRRADGTVWGEQATYADGDRQGGIARASAAAHTQVLSRRVIGQLGIAANFVRYTVLDSTGNELRTWSTPLCGSMGSVRLDRPNSPDEPTFPGSWEGCEREFEGAFVLGRVTGLDRGWAMQLPSRVSTIGHLADGRYQLRVDIDPLDAVADADRSNDSATVPLVVRTTRRSSASEDCEFCIPEDGPTKAAARAAAAKHDHAAPVDQEPEWYADRLHLVEAALEARAARREAGRVPRIGESAPSAPADVDLPDLQAAPSYEIHTGTVRRAGARRDLLRFGALTWNAGPGPLEVEAFRESGTTLGAYQVFSRDGKRATRQARGTLVWHAAPGHDHFHFNAFAAYRLVKLDGSLVRDGGKHSWCIVDTDQVDTTRPGVAMSRFGGGGAADCGSNPGSLWARLSLSVGSGDFYGPDLAGQSFDITGVPNGTYRVQVEANPTDVIAEANHDNNTSERTVTLGGRPGARTVVARPHPLINEDAEGDFDCTDC